MLLPQTGGAKLLLARCTLHMSRTACAAADGSSASCSALLARDGYFVLPQLLQEKEVDAMRHSVDQLLRNGATPIGGHPAVLVGKNLFGRSKGGWFVADFPAEPRLAHIETTVDAKSQLHDALRDALGGDGRYQQLARRDLHVDYSTGWHQDSLHGELLAYETATNLPFTAEAMLADGDAPRIVTLALYLQAHPMGNPGLTVHPGTHRPFASWNASMRPEESCVLRKGDGVVFDALTYHRGVTRPVNARHSLDFDHRILATIYYGRWPSAFSETQHRGFGMRNNLLNNRSFWCGGRTHPRTDGDRCARQHVHDDIRRHPPPAGLADPQEAARVKAMRTIGTSLMGQHHAARKGRR